MSDKEAKEFLQRGKFTLKELMKQTFPPVVELIPGMVSTGLVLLVAAPKIGKSWMCLDLALQAASGGSVFGCLPVGQRPVLYLALEDGARRLQNRLRKLGVNGAPQEGDLSFITDLGRDKPTDLIRIFMDSHADTKPLVILDTLGKVKGMAAHVSGETDYERDYRLMSELKDIVDSCDGATLLIVHHTRKMGSDDFLDTISGTNGIGGAADTILKIDRQRNSTDAILQVTSRDAAEGSYAIVFNSETGRWTLGGDTLESAADAVREKQQTDNVGDRMEEVIRYVNSHPNGVHPYELSNALGIDARQTSNYLNRAADSGRVSKLRRGLYAPIHKGGESDESDEYRAEDNGSAGGHTEPDSSHSSHSSHTVGSEADMFLAGLPEFATGLDFTALRVEQLEAIRVRKSGLWHTKAVDELERRKANGMEEVLA